MLIQTQDLRSLFKKTKFYFCVADCYNNNIIRNKNITFTTATDPIILA